MRGKVAGGSDTDHQLRITPAYAGKSISAYALVYLSGDHPRLCGEKSLMPQPMS